jgi:GMP synthase (glutamine-hydrolysing)
LQHSNVEHLGRIAKALTQENVEYTYIRPDLGQPVPATLDGYHGLVVMGGPQSVYEEDQFPFLKAEKSLTRDAVATNRPVLGVCLGSQILAAVLGSRVYAGKMFELGWKNVTISPEATDDPVLKHLPREITPLHWHGDVYDLPPGAKCVGSSQLTPVQGFVCSQRFYGFLFHLEAELEQIAAMVATFPDDVRRGSATQSALLAEAPERVAALRDLGLEVFRRWAALL